MKRFLTAFSLAALFYWLLWGGVFLFLPPQTLQNYLFFFLALLGALTFTSALVIYFLVGFFTSPTDPRGTLRESLRRGFLVSLCFCGFLLLKLLHLVSPFNIGLLVTAIISLEVYFSQ